MAHTDGYLMVVALDFGTTYSGYAFSMKTDFDTDPLKIDANQWSSGHQSLSSLKTPTCLFLDKKKKCLAFGYRAEDMHADFVMDGKIDGHYYFHRFKMNLHNNKNITKDMVLEDITGKRLPAVDVFRLFIQALVEDLLAMLKRQGTCVQMKDIRWVLTVPAIWTDVAKQFMRLSAERAGIPKDKLVLALEPETASIFCQYLPTEKLQGTAPGFTMTEEGTRYMVVDIGGGTADITVHEKATNGRLKELYRATGNDYGGTSVDKMFFTMLESIVGENVMKVFKEKDPLGYLNIEREFEARKRLINAQTDGKVNLTFPIVSLDIYCKEIHGKDFKSLLSSSSHSTTMQIFHDKIRIDADIVRELFKSTIDKIMSLINEILSNNSTAGVSHILMVGGFSECQLVYDAVNKKFPAKRIIIPKEAGLSVMKGAVLFGHRPDFVQSRVMRFSYGVKTNVPFDERKFDVKHLKEMEGEEKCDNIFSMIAEKDQQIEAGTVVKRSYFTPYRNQEVMDFMIYTSTKRFPAYVDDEGCLFLAKPTITFSDLCEDKRWVDVEYTFGNTELALKAVDRNSGNEMNASFNLV